MRPAKTALAAAFAACFVALPALAEDGTVKSHGVSLFGDLKYGPDFQHFDYVNPDAPKGGTLREEMIGTFDTLNPFQLKGNKAPATGVFETLLEQSYDEPDSSYGLIAESVEIPADHLWAQFTLRKEARFHDGSPITPEDVIWTFDTLKEHGNPRYRLYYADVLKAEKVGERSVRFTFRSAENHELPSILGQLFVLSKKYWDGRDFEKTTLEPPLGSGPYKIESVEPGRSITFQRVKDYWGKDLPVNRGRSNFDTLRVDYYRDRQVALEAFKAGAYDIREEFTSKNWAKGYDSPALRDGLFKMEDIPNKMPQGMQAFVVFNLRRPLFQDSRVREAFDYLFDFEWMNKNLFYGAYKRTASYFPNTDLAATGLPKPEELAILEKFKGEIPDEVFTKPYAPPATDGSGNIRDNLRQALRLLKEAGWSVKDEKLVNDKTGQPFVFEFIEAEADFERLLLPFKQSLARAGIAMNLRTVDPAQYENRLKSFDYDVTMRRFPPTLSPGNEQREMWGSAAADEPGSYNIIGVKSKVIDDLVDLVIASPSRGALLARTHAFDRVLLANHYVVPGWYQSSFHLAYWDKFGRPKVSPPYVLATDTWWIDPARAQAVEAKKAQEPKQ